MQGCDRSEQAGERPFNQVLLLKDVEVELLLEQAQ